MPRSATSHKPLALDPARADARPEDVEHARRVGERLRAELAAVVGEVPIAHRPVASMSRWLGVSRPVCHRAAACARAPGDGLRALEEAPGVRGLASFLTAARAKGVSPDALKGAEAAVGDYAALLDHFGSRSRLLDALRDAAHDAPDPDTSEDPSIAARRLAFEGMRATLRREHDCQVGVYLYGPSSGGDPETIDCITSLGLIGVRLTPNAMPICPVSRFAAELPSGDDTWTVPAMRTPGEPGGPSVGLVQPFCSTPTPRIVARREGSRVPVLVEASERPDRPFDAVLGRHLRDLPHPGLDEPRTQFCWVVADGPSRHLAMQVYLHRDLARACVVSSGVYAKDPVGTMTPDSEGRPTVALPRDRWYDRLPDVPTIEYLGVGLDQAGCPEYARMADLTAHLFRLGGWDPAHFVGYRIRVPYPVWNAQHLMWFDFEDTG